MLLSQMAKTCDIKSPGMKANTAESVARRTGGKRPGIPVIPPRTSRPRPSVDRTSSLWTCHDEILSVHGQVKLKKVGKKALGKFFSGLEE